jgi:hypothetical protein
MRIVLITNVVLLLFGSGIRGDEGWPFDQVITVHRVCRATDILSHVCYTQDDGLLSISNDLLTTRPGLTDAQKPLNPPNILVSTADLKSPLWEKCQKIPPDPKLLSFLKITLRILPNCLVFEDIPAEDGFPEQFIEIANTNMGSVDIDESIFSLEGENFEINLARLEARTEFRFKPGAFKVDVNLKATYAAVAIKIKEFKIAAQASAGIFASLTSEKVSFFARASADVTISAGPIDFNAGLGFDSGVEVGKNGIEVKVAGTGFSFTTEKIEVCIVFCVTLNYGSFFEDGKVTYEPPYDIYNDPLRASGNNVTVIGTPHYHFPTMVMIREWHSEILTRKAEEDALRAAGVDTRRTLSESAKEAEEVLARVFRVLRQGRLDIEKQSEYTLKKICESKDEKMREMCTDIRRDDVHTEAEIDDPVKTKGIKEIKIKKGQMGKS